VTARGGASTAQRPRGRLGSFGEGGERLGARTGKLLRRGFSRELWERLLAHRTVQRALRGAIGSEVALLALLWLGIAGVYNLRYTLSIFPSLLSGFYITITLVRYIIPLGFGLGLLVGVARTSRSVWLRGFGAVYVDLFRSLPPIALIFFAFLLGLLALHPLDNPLLVQTIALWLGATALAFHTGAYQAEIVRAGILSVPATQTDAAAAVGLSRGQTFVSVTLPQAFRVSLPALGNEFSSVIKDSSLLSVIGWLDLTGIAAVQVYTGILVSIFFPLLIWLVVGVLYFVVTFLINVVVRGVEELFKVPGLEASAL
jgi:glutamine transport system permease protein